MLSVISHVPPVTTRDRLPATMYLGTITNNRTSHARVQQLPLQISRVMQVPASLSPSVFIGMPQLQYLCFFLRRAQLYNCIVLFILSNWVPPLDRTISVYCSLSAVLPRDEAHVALRLQRLVTCGK